MKKILFINLVLWVLFIGNSNGQQTEKKKGWPPIERHGFITFCINEAKLNMSEDSARFYCYCMQDKVEKKYPALAEAGKITEADMQTTAWQKDIKGCLNGFWNTAEREAFLTECMESAKKGGSSEENAKTSCECMLYKIEIKYPNPLDAGGFTPEKLNSPERKKIIKGCRDF
jgi:hypothetical protein